MLPLQGLAGRTMRGCSVVRVITLVRAASTATARLPAAVRRSRGISSLGSASEHRCASRYAAVSGEAGALHPSSTQRSRVDRPRRLASGATAAHGAAASELRRAALAASAAVTALTDPTRDDAVAILGETTAGGAPAAMRDRMAESATGRRLLAERPRISAQLLQRSRTLPDGTLGREYARYMDAHGFNPDGRKPVRFIKDEELAWVVQRYREVHDFWHVIAGLPPTVLGEVALKWVEMVQTGLPMAALSAFVGPLRLRGDEQRLLACTLIPWASRAAGDAVCLMAVEYEAMLDRTVEDVRRELNFSAAPSIPVREASSSRAFDPDDPFGDGFAPLPPEARDERPRLADVFLDDAPTEEEGEGEETGTGEGSTRLYPEELQAMEIKSESFYEEAAARREYFYYIDLRGRLFLEDTLPKTVATSLKSARFLQFFWKRLRPNETGQYEEYPWFSPCGKERNYIKCADTPVVFDALTDGVLQHGEVLEVPFDPAALLMSNEGRLYHEMPSGSRYGALGLLHTDLAGRLSAHLVPSESDDDGMDFEWEGRRYPLRVGDAPHALVED